MRPLPYNYSVSYYNEFLYNAKDYLLKFGVVMQLQQMFCIFVFNIYLRSIFMDPNYKGNTNSVLL